MAPHSKSLFKKYFIKNYILEVLDMLCPFCKEEILDGAIKCKHCGSMLSEGSTVSVPPPASTPSSAITDEEYSSFIGKNASYYLMKFKSFGAGGFDSFKATWHWPAFFFTFPWLIYRKLYLWALLVFILGCIPFVGIIVMIVFGMSANYIYYKHTKKKIAEIKYLHPTSDTQRHVEYARAGGVNAVALWIIGIFLLLFFFLLAAIAIPQFIQYKKRGYVSTLNTDCKNAYTASVAHWVDNPDDTYITLEELESAGLSKTAGVTVETYNLNGTSGSITCSGPDAWGVTPAVININEGMMNITPSKIR